MEKRNIVITGGGGFIGTHFAELFSVDNHVTLFDNFDRDALMFAPALRDNANVTVINGSVEDSKALNTVFDGAYMVIHLAAIAGVSNYYTRSIKTLRVNILGTFNVLDAAVRNKVQRVIYFSTSEVYGSHADRVTEENPMTSGPVSDRRWVYSVSKQAGEHAMLRYGEEHQIGVTCIRPFNVYGPRQIGEGAVANFCRRLLAGETIQIYGDGKDIRSWCYISDLLDAMIGIVDNPDTFGKSFNIGNPNSYCDVNELAEVLIATNSGGEIERLPREHDPVLLRLPNIDRAKSVFGFNPTVSLEVGMRKTFDWFKSIEV